MPRFSNTEIGPLAVKVEDIHKFIGMKLIKKDRAEIFCLDDEAAQAGLESRGSGSKGAAIESRIITHSRKAGAWLILVSQLKSMLDKRAQWVEGYSILCEAEFDDGNIGIVPDRFHYTVFDKALTQINEFWLDVEDCKKYIWPGMDTFDIPAFEDFKDQFIAYWGIGAEDEIEYQDKMETAYRYVKAEQVPIGGHNP